MSIPGRFRSRSGSRRPRIRCSASSTGSGGAAASRARSGATWSLILRVRWRRDRSSTTSRSCVAGRSERAARGRDACRRLSSHPSSPRGRGSAGHRFAGGQVEREPRPVGGDTTARPARRVEAAADRRRAQLAEHLVDRRVDRRRPGREDREDRAVGLDLDVGDDGGADRREPLADAIRVRDEERRTEGTTARARAGRCGLGGGLHRGLRLDEQRREQHLGGGDVGGEPDDRRTWRTRRWNTDRQRELFATQWSSTRLRVDVRIVDREPHRDRRSPRPVCAARSARSMAWRVMSSCALAVNASASASNVVDSAWASSVRTCSSIGSFVRDVRSMGASGVRVPGGGIRIGRRVSEGNAPQVRDDRLDDAGASRRLRRGPFGEPARGARRSSAARAGRAARSSAGRASRSPPARGRPRSRRARAGRSCVFAARRTCRTSSAGCQPAAPQRARQP